MQNIVGFGLFFGIVVLMLGGSLVLSRRQAKKARANLAALAQDLGMQLEEKPPALGIFPQVPTVSGQYGGRAIRFYTFTTGSGKSRQTWQAVGLGCENPHGLILKLGARSFLSALDTLFGPAPVKLGDAAFDERFVLKTSDPDFVRAALVPELRVLLQQQWAPRAPAASVRLEGAQLLYTEIGSFSDPAVLARMKAMLEPLRELATLPEVYRK